MEPNQNKHIVSEISPKRKKKFYIGVGIYILSFIVLTTIGSDINRNGYIIRGFLASFLVITGIIYTTYALVNQKD